MCHCAENRRLLLAALGGASPVAATLAKVGANMGEDAQTLAARAASVARAQLAAARGRLRK